MNRGKGINNNDLKRRNRGLVLKLIAARESNTRVDIARASKLTKMSVTNIIDEFIHMNLVEEGGREKKDFQGRSPSLLDFSPNAPKVIGVLINRGYCAAVLCDFHLNALRSARREIDCQDKDRLLEIIYGLVDEMMAAEKNILGIGVASIGPLDVAGGVLLSPPRFYGIKNLPLASLLEEKYGLPVFLDHQYNSAARAEKLYGCGKDFSSFVFVGVTDGIGAGIYLDGDILKSGSGLGSELGHMSVDYNGSPCECGSRGCVENYASVNVILKQVETAVGRRMTFEECLRHSQEEVIDRILIRALDKLCCCLVSVSNLLNPEAVILGHEGVKLPERYLEWLEAQLNKRKLSEDYNHVRILKPHFGEEAQLVGAACNVLAQVFEGEILFT